MNKKKTFFLGVAFICCTINIYGQAQYKPLNKGDVLPSLTVQLCKDENYKIVNLHDYKGKLILLDFWGVHCVDCIASLPHMLELQKQFGDKIKILVVTTDEVSEVKSLWNRFLKKTNYPQWVDAGKQLDFVMGDSLLSRLFPHDVLPTHVWIDSNLTVKGVVYPASTTASNIQAYFNGIEPALFEQKHIELDIDAPLNWFRESIADAGNTPCYSFLTNHIEFGNGSRRFIRYQEDSVTGTVIGLTCINMPILELYKIAYKDELKLHGLFPDNRLMVETKDSVKFFSGADVHAHWTQKNSFCYAVKLQTASAKEFYAAMKTNLDFSFGLKSGIEKRRMRCWVLKINPGSRKLQTNGGQEVYESRSSFLVMHNMEFENLSRELKNVISLQDPDAIFVDETNHLGRIDISLPWNQQIEKVSISSLQASLHDYGLDLVEQFRDIDVLVVSDCKMK